MVPVLTQFVAHAKVVASTRLCLKDLQARWLFYAWLRGLYVGRSIYCETSQHDLLYSFEMVWGRLTKGEVTPKV